MRIGSGVIMCSAVLSAFAPALGNVTALLWRLVSLPLRLHTMPYVSFYVLWCGTIATAVFSAKTGRITASWQSAYSYCFWNYGCTAGFCGGGSCFKELSGCILRNLVHFD